MAETPDRKTESARLVLLDDGRGCLELTGAHTRITKSPIKFERVYVHPLEAQGKQVTRGAYITNSAETATPSCEAVVFEGDARAGTTRIDELPPGSRCLIGYADEPGISVSPSPSSQHDVTDARIVNGSLHVKRSRIHTQQYVVTNETSENIPLIVEYPFSPQRRVVEPTEFEEKTSKVWRFRFHIYRHCTRTVTIREEEVVREESDIATAPEDSLREYLRGADISKSIRDALEKAIRMRSEGKKKALTAYLENLNVP